MMRRKVRMWVVLNLPRGGGGAEPRRGIGVGPRGRDAQRGPQLSLVPTI
jgi:hypothetical protein